MMTEVLSVSASGTESLKCGRVSDSSSGDVLQNGASDVNGSDPGRVMYHVLPIYTKKKKNVSGQLIVMRKCLFASQYRGIEFTGFR